MSVRVSLKSEEILKREDLFWALRHWLGIVVNTPEGRHPIQVEVAQELKQWILDIRKLAPNETQERIGNAIKTSETGKFKQYL